MSDISEKTLKLVKEAGKLFDNKISEKSRVIKKSHANFVTEVDYKLQEFITGELIKIIPDCNIITEESNSNKFNLDKPTWVLDPLDGTTNFMHDYHHSAISLGLYVDGTAKMGIIYNPNSSEMFYAEAENGAYLNGSIIKTSPIDTFEDCLIGFGTTPYDRSKAAETFKLVERIYMKCQEVRRSGSAALDMAYVASGRIDGFFELNLQPWDIAAGLLILKEAGGKTTNLQGERLSILGPTGVLATNGLIHDTMLDLINDNEISINPWKL